MALNHLAFFGAFNPPTKAHVALAEAALNEVGANSVIFVPSKRDYILKVQNKNFSFSDAERYTMLEHIRMTHSWMNVSSFDLITEKQLGSYIALKHLSKSFSNVRLLLGSDKLLELENGWNNSENILEEFGVVCINRGEDNLEKIISENTFLSKHKNRIQIVEVPGYEDISSTKVRNIIFSSQQNKEEDRITDRIKDLVPHEILNDIEEYTARQRIS